MTNMPTLRMIIARSVVAAMALEASACCGDAPGQQSRVVELRDNMKWSMLMENCRADEAECESLCQLVLEELEGAAAQSVYFSVCELDDSSAVPKLYMDYNDASACGRRPMVGDEKVATCDPESADYFTRAAILEAEAVQAFHEMAGHLQGFGAPGSLIERCRKAAQEELGHALVMSQLARKLSGDPKLLPSLRSREQIWRNARMGVNVHVPSLEEFANHNGREGCVRESLGAAVALWQSVHSSDPQVRKVLARIALDEVAHAQLSWDVDRWCRSQLTAPERTRLALAKTDAARSLWRGLSANDNEAGGLAGLPSAASSRQLLEQIAGSSWGLAVSQSSS